MTSSGSRRLQVVLSVGVIGLAAGPASLVGPPSTFSAPPTAELRLDVRAGAAQARETIRCPGSPASSCRRLHSAEALRLLTTAPCPAAGSDEYGGAAVLTARGKIDGRPIRMTLTRTNGCRIARWSALERLFGGPLRLNSAA